MTRAKETSLYGPVKTLLQAQGYEVKGEVGAADVVALRGGEPPLIVELKTGFSLSLLHQAVERQAVTENVYVAVPMPKGGPRGRSLRANLALCRRLGLGVITVSASGIAEVHCDPGPYAARSSKKRRERLLQEFQRRSGDPNEGGATRHGIVTSYRQEALRCATYLAEYGTSRGAAVARDTSVPRATAIMAANHYGWFERVSKGHYRLTDGGRAALVRWSESLG